MKRMLDQKQIDQLAELLNGHIPNEKFKELIESLGGISLKAGYYIWKDTTLVNVEELPEDYNGFCIEINYDNDAIFLAMVENQAFTSHTMIDPSAITFSYDGEYCNVTKKGVDKLDFTQLTHSFNELDPTLKQIVDDAITDGATDGVACSEAQWSAIKSLLDKSLYLSYDGYSLIKTWFDGINYYTFGYLGDVQGSSLEISYNDTDALLYIKPLDI